MLPFGGVNIRGLQRLGGGSIGIRSTLDWVDPPQRLTVTRQRGPVTRRGVTEIRGGARGARTRFL